MSSLPLNEGDIAATIVANMPPIDSTAPVVGTATPAAPAQPMYTDVEAKRHGGVVGRLMGMGYRDAYGKPLDEDMQSTAGDVFGELFGLLSRFGNRWIYVSTLLGVTILPLAGLMAWRLFKATEPGKEPPHGA